MLILDKTNAIIDWRDSLGRNIFFPQQTIRDSLRGGAHSCAPIFGTVPIGSSAWRGVNLPRHGLVRVPGSEDCLTVSTNRQGWQVTQKHFASREGYPYAFTTEEAVIQRSNQDGTSVTLEHKIKITRDQDCANPNWHMPCQIAWHPYFATHDEGFKLLLGLASGMDSNDRTDPALVFDWFGQDCTLLTKHHQIVFKFEGDIGEVVAWSADKKKYFCVEPVSKEIMLCRGDQREISTLLSVSNRT